MKIPAIQQRPWLAAALAVAAVTGAWFLRPQDAVPASGAALGQAAKSPARESSAPRSDAERLKDEWQSILAACGEDASPEDLRRQLGALKRRWLLEDDLHGVGLMCAQLLRSGADAKTGIPFEVGPGGALAGWPTMRLFLLEVLGEADPDLAMELGREILGSTGSAEEFAVALKALTKGGPWRAPDSELEGYFAKMLHKQEWQRSPGLAEGLDIARTLATPAATATLAAWLKTAPPARVAGQMAIHETAATNPQLVVGIMSSQPALLEGEAGMRASLVARASVSDQGQAEMVEDYLHNPAVPAEEKRDFLKLFPMRSATTGYRLYGKAPSPYEQSAVVQDDQAALQAVTRWKADPALAELLPEMNKLEGRLQTWVTQAASQVEE